MVELDEELEVCVLMGGTSSEREVSLNSGENVYEALDKGSAKLTPLWGEFSKEDELLDLIRTADIVFNALHGGIGEDGTMQALLEILDIPYTGTGPLGSSIAMNKLHSKEAFHRASIATPGYVEGAGRSKSELANRVSDQLDFPVSKLIPAPVNSLSFLGIVPPSPVKFFPEKID